MIVGSMPEEYVDGTDWSKWQGVSDVKIAMSRGIKYFFFKATQGTYTKDVRFPEYRAQAEAEGQVWAPYHFFDARYDGVLQANYLHSYVGNYQGLPPVVDLELTYGVPKATLNSRFKACLDRLEVLYGRKPIIYTSPWFFTYWINRSPNWKNYILWIANYNVEAPDLPPDWTEWGFWQWTSKGNGPYYGVSSMSVDLDRSTFTVEELQQMAGQAPVPPPDPAPQAGHFDSYCFTTALNVRSGPGTSYPIVRTLTFGEAVNVFGHEYNAADGYSWAKIKEDGSQWCWIRWLTMTKP